MATRTRSLANDPEFQAFYRSAASMGASILRTGATLTATHKQAQVAALNSGDSPAARTVLASMGTSQGVIDEQRRLVGSVVTRYQLPKDPAQLATIFRGAATAARWSYPDGGGPAPDPLDEIEDELDLPDSTGSGGSGGSDDDNNSSCYDLCALQAAALAASALTTYTLALAACTAAGPFGIVCALAATASYAIALYEMDAAVDRCVANCG
jgi:hypothetical protein